MTTPLGIVINYLSIFLPFILYYILYCFVSTGQSKTILGSINGTSELGAIPCAISWLYKGINERRQKSGARFSVRVSALGVSATKPEQSSKDLLAAHATGEFKLNFTACTQR